jgi:hypothetical protein
MFFLIAMCDRTGLVTASTGEPLELPAEACASLPGQSYTRSFAHRENREDPGSRPGVETEDGAHRFGGAGADTHPFVSAGAVRILPDPLRLAAHGDASSFSIGARGADASSPAAPTSVLALGSQPGNHQFEIILGDQNYLTNALLLLV